MEIGYKLSGLQPGDEVIVPSITFIATIAYPLMIGAKVVFADVDPRNVNMDPADVARKITKKTRVIVPVHIGGYPCDMTKIMKVAKQHDVHVMEDAAHGLGAVYKGKPLGTIGHFGGAQPTVNTIENGLEVLRIAWAAYRASRTGAAVSMDTFDPLSD